MAANWNSSRAIATLGKRAIRHSAAAAAAVREFSAVSVAALTRSTRRVEYQVRELKDRCITANNLKRFRSKFWNRSYSTVYEKNLDDQLRPGLQVPDDLIPAESEKYWAPHPQTAVFSPVTDQSTPAEQNSTVRGGGVDSDLEEKAWFRPTSLEDLEKPHHP